MRIRFLNKLLKHFENALIINKKNVRIRIGIIMLIFSFGFSYLFVKIHSIAMQDNDFKFNVINTHILNNKRREIIDRNGVLLATDLATYSLYANPKKIIDPHEAADKLIDIFPSLNYENLFKELSSDRKFIWIKRNLTPSEHHAVNNLGVPGLAFEESYKRVYPHNNLFSHVIGYVGIDGKGLAGIEQYLNDQLLIKDATDNKPVELSLDVRIQHILHQELKSSMEEFSAIGAAGTIASAKTGEIMGFVSLPDFDPHHPDFENPDKMFNRVSLGTNEVGSIFKAITIAMALENKKINLNSSFDVSNPIQVARFQLRDYHPYNGSYSVPEIFMHSSNIGTAKIALEVGANEQQKFLKKLGLLDVINIELPERGNPLFPRNNWSNLSSMTISYGHGIAVTQLHMIKAMSALVNGGNLINLTLLKNPVNKDNEKVISEETSQNIRKLLRLVVAKGTGKKAAAEGYIVGGKTGTADKASIGGYNRKARMSYFIGAFPMNDPEYVMLIMLDEPKGTKQTAGFATGGWTAAPVMSRVVSKIAPLLNIKPVDENSLDIKDKLWLDYYAKSQDGTL